MEEKNNNTKGAAITGVIAAIAASSCCIPPVVALIAGVGGASTTLSWMEPFRPYLIGLAVVAIAYAWYVNLKPKKVDDCDCETEKPKFYQTKGFLIGMTLFAIISIAFPYYSGIFYPGNNNTTIIVNEKDIQKIEIKIEGMTCDACQNHIDHAVNELPGIVAVNSSYEKGNAVIEFDQTKVSVEEIEAAVNATGYKTTKIETHGN